MDVLTKTPRPSARRRDHEDPQVDVSIEDVAADFLAKTAAAVEADRRFGDHQAESERLHESLGEKLNEAESLAYEARARLIEAIIRADGSPLPDDIEWCESSSVLWKVRSGGKLYGLVRSKGSDIPKTLEEAAKGVSLFIADLADLAGSTAGPEPDDPAEDDEEDDDVEDEGVEDEDDSLAAVVAEVFDKEPGDPVTFEDLVRQSTRRAIARYEDAVRWFEVVQQMENHESGPDDMSPWMKFACDGVDPARHHLMETILAHDPDFTESDSRDWDDRMWEPVCVREGAKVYMVVSAEQEDYGMMLVIVDASVVDAMAG
jgi:hypothetical protein